MARLEAFFIRCQSVQRPLPVGSEASAHCERDEGASNGRCEEPVLLAVRGGQASGKREVAGYPKGNLR